MSSLVLHDYLSQLTSQLTTLVDRLRTRPGLSAALVAGSVGLTLTPWAYSNYKLFLTLGRSGGAPGVSGWLMALVFKPFERETMSTDVYEQDANKEKWLVGGEGKDEIPFRNRPRPRTGWHCVPHRQVDQNTESKKIQELVTKEFRAIASANSDVVAIAVSPHERMGNAMVVHPSLASPHKVADAGWREIGHIHTQKCYSIHVMLAPQDCKLLIERGWAERHPMSGTFVLPKEYIMVYAPLTEDDVRVAGLIMRAAVGFMTGRKEVR